MRLNGAVRLQAIENYGRSQYLEHGMGKIRYIRADAVGVDS